MQVGRGDGERDSLGGALCLAVGRASLEVLSALINEGADVNYVSHFVCEGEDITTTPLVMAGAGQQGPSDICGPPVINLLIRRGTDVNKANPCDGHTPLHEAAEYGSLPVIELLISKGARIDARNKLGRTPLFQAATKGHRDAAICLLDHGADINAQAVFGFTPLFHAAQFRHPPLVDLLLTRGANPNLSTNAASEFEGQTALHKSSYLGDLEIVQRLVEGGADVNQQDAKGYSSLCAAAQNGHLKIVKLLVKKGANIHEADQYGRNPLHMAAFNHRHETVDYLIRKGAEFVIRGTPAEACKCCGATDVPLKICRGCMIICYCSPECQKKDWKQKGAREKSHKIQCTALVEMKESYIEKAKKEIEEQMAGLGIQSDEGNEGQALLRHEVNF